jgi:hypothetical protein
MAKTGSENARDKKRQAHESSRRHRRLGTRRRWQVLGVLAGILLAAWLLGVYYLHTSTTVEKVANGLDATLTVSRTDPLQRAAVANGGTYEAYAITHAKDAHTSDRVYVISVRRDRRAPWYVRPFFPSRTMRLAVYLNQFDTIQRVWALSPDTGEPPASQFQRFLDRWPGTAYGDLIDRSKPLQFPDGGAYAVPVRDELGVLAGSVYIHRYGQDAYERMLVTMGMAGLQVGDTLPSFSLATVDGITVDGASLVGRRTILMTVSPYCGSCFDAVTAILKKVPDNQVGKEWNVVLIMLAKTVDDRAKALLAGAPKGVIAGLDPDELLSRRLFMFTSPFVVILDPAGKVAYRGSGYKVDDVILGIQGVQAGN